MFSSRKVRTVLVSGAAAAAALTLTASTTVSAFTSNSTITGAVKRYRGVLLVKNAGVFTSTADGSIVDLQTIVGGTGRLAGATGFIRASGTFSFTDGGTSVYEGSICLP